MLARYSNDIAGFDRMIASLENSRYDKIIETFKSEVHHQNEITLGIAKLAGILTMKAEAERVSFFELGQTIFGCIDTMEFSIQLIRKLGLKNIRGLDFPVLSKDVSWYGYDPSDLFNLFSKKLHSGYSICAESDYQKIPERYDVFYSKGITLLYAIREIRELYKMIERGTCAIFDYSFSMSGTEEATVGSGKVIAYLDLKDFVYQLKQSSRELWINPEKSHIDREKNRIWLDCLFAPPEISKRYIENDLEMRTLLAKKMQDIPNSSALLIDSRPGWIKLLDYLEEQKISI
jgi:hypothetical protein